MRVTQYTLIDKPEKLQLRSWHVCQEADVLFRATFLLHRRANEWRGCRLRNAMKKREKGKRDCNNVSTPNSGRSADNHNAIIILHWGKLSFLSLQPARSLVSLILRYQLQAVFCSCLDLVTRFSFNFLSWRMLRRFVRNFFRCFDSVIRDNRRSRFESMSRRWNKVETWRGSSPQMEGML